MDSDQRGGAGGVEGHAGAVQVERVGEAVGGDAVGVAGAGVGVDVVGMAELQPRIIVAADAHVHGRLAAAQRQRILSGVFQRFPRGFEQ